MVRRCPRCGSTRLQPVGAAGRANLLCTACHRCWQLEQGHFVEVNPYACSRCAAPHLCRAR